MGKLIRDFPPGTNQSPVKEGGSESSQHRFRLCCQGHEGLRVENVRKLLRGREKSLIQRR